MRPPLPRSVSAFALRGPDGRSDRIPRVLTQLPAASAAPAGPPGDSSSQPRPSCAGARGHVPRVPGLAATSLVARGCPAFFARPRRGVAWSFRTSATHGASSVLPHEPMGSQPHCFSSVSLLFLISSRVLSGTFVFVSEGLDLPKRIADSLAARRVSPVSQECDLGRGRGRTVASARRASALLALATVCTVQGSWLPRCDLARLCVAPGLERDGRSVARSPFSCSLQPECPGLTGLS